MSGCRWLPGRSSSVGVGQGASYKMLDWTLDMVRVLKQTEKIA